MIHRIASSWLRRAFAFAIVATLTDLATSYAQEPVRRPSEPVPIDALDPPPRTPPDLPILSEVIEADAPPPLWLPSLDGIRGVSIMRYNRSDGLVPAWGFQLDATNPATTPTIRVRGGLATTHSQGYWRVEVDQQLPFGWPTRAMVRHFKRPNAFETWRVSKRENDLATFVATADRLDWWRERGFEVMVDTESPGGRTGLSMTFFNANQRSLASRDPFALFGDDYRFNAGVAEGTLRSLTLALRYDDRDVQSPLLPAPGWTLRADWERSGGLLGGDIDFVRGFADLRRYNRIGRDAWLDFRLVWIGALTERGVPPQRRVRLGGPGSLRGFPTAAFTGDEALQIQTELRLPLPTSRPIALLFLNWHLVGLFDAGVIDDYDELHANVGVGLSGINLFSYLGFFVAQRVTDLDLPEDGPRFIVRLRRDF